MSREDVERLVAAAIREHEIRVALWSGLLGALLTFTDQPVYAPHFLTTASWGLSPLEDQQAAGLRASMAA